jgi:4-hydroxy-3-polyprenylbenzoate decarboxylase
MACKDLAEFWGMLAARGDLARVAVPVEPDLELAEITRRVASAGGPALLFENVGPGSLAIATNVWGTVGRACAALGIPNLDELAGRLEATISQQSSPGWLDRFTSGGANSNFEKLSPKLVKQAPCQQVVHLGRDVDLASFALVRCDSGEEEPGITGGLCITQSPTSRERNVVRLSLTLLDSDRMVAIDDGDSIFSRHFREHQKAGQPMPAALVLGGDPALMALASLDMPPAVDVWHLAGILRGRSLEVVSCRTHSLEVPADAEVILEGHFETHLETLHRPLFHVSAVTRRTRPIVPAIIDWGSSGDLATLQKVRERALLPQLRKLNANIQDLSLPAAGGAQAFVVVSLRTASAGLVRQVAAVLWGCDALRFTKFLVFVDSEVNVHDSLAVLAAVGANVNLERDLFTYDGPPRANESAGETSHLVRRIGLDATRGMPHKNAVGSAAGEEIVRAVTARWAEYGLP